MAHMTLTEFLLARIQEDELTAQAAIARDASWGVYFGDQVHDDLGVIVVPVSSAEVAEHISRHDPARVLAECEAKRQVIAAADRPGDPVGSAVMEFVLGRLALPYAEHLDYRDEWRP